MAIFSNNVSIANDGELIGGGTEWQAVKTANYTASAGEGIFANTTSGAFTVTLPSSPSQGDEVTIVDYAGTFGSNNLTVARNGSNIDGAATDATLSTNRLNVRFVYADATQGWKAIFDDVTSNYGGLYINATGGTVTTSGDYKIHSFTGDGCFVVSSLGGGGTPCAEATSVDYLVVGGGGGGGNSNGGGGGAGGFRIASGFSISATTYPITIGGGGTGQIGSPAPAASGPAAVSGSNSVFSTITSTGGGYGGSGAGTGPFGIGANGGSGGGGGTNNQANGSGNTPPVSPPQGNPGGYGAGPGTPQPQAGGGGGGAGQAGGSVKPAGGPAFGGDGSPAVPIFGAAPQPFYIANGPNAGASACGVFAGGGGGGRCVGSGSPEPGGDGGGGNSTNSSATGAAGVANTGGGGGGGGYSPPGGGGAGGKGIVLIRYKFQ